MKPHTFYDSDAMFATSAKAPQKHCILKHIYLDFGATY